MLLEVFTQRNFIAHFIRLKLNFIPKQKQKNVFEPLFGRLRGNIGTPSIARWKGRGQLSMRRDLGKFNAHSKVSNSQLQGSQDGQKLHSIYLLYYRV